MASHVWGGKDGVDTRLVAVAWGWSCVSELWMCTGGRVSALSAVFWIYFDKQNRLRSGLWVTGGKEGIISSGHFAVSSRRELLLLVVKQRWRH